MIKAKQDELSIQNPKKVKKEIKKVYPRITREADADDIGFKDHKDHYTVGEGSIGIIKETDEDGNEINEYYILDTRNGNEITGLDTLTAARKELRNYLNEYKVFITSEKKYYGDSYAQGGGIDFETKQVTGHGDSHKNNTHFAIHKPTDSIAEAWDYDGYDNKELMEFKDDYFWQDVRDNHEGNVDKFKKSDFIIVTRKNLSKKGIDLADYKSFVGQKYAKGGEIGYSLEWEDDEGDTYTESFDTLEKLNAEIKYIKDSNGRVTRKSKYRGNDFVKDFDKGGSTYSEGGAVRREKTKDGLYKIYNKKTGQYLGEIEKEMGGNRWNVYDETGSQIATGQNTMYIAITPFEIKVKEGKELYEEYIENMSKGGNIKGSYFTGELSFLNW